MLSSRSQSDMVALDRGNLFPSSSTRRLGFRTPARTLKHGRAVHDENAVYGHPRTAGLTGRKKAGSVVFSTPAVRGPLQPRLKTDKVSRTASKASVLSEITNKTPFPISRFPVTPGPVSLKPSKPITILNGASAAPSTRRISSTRKKLRLPRSTSKSFETPETRGDHWDVSEGSIEVSMIEETSITEEDYDDVEYGPPTAIEPKYDLPFDMPDYKKVGMTLLSLFRESVLPEDHDPVAEFDDAALLSEIGPLEWDQFDLPDIPVENVFPSICQSSTQVLRDSRQPQPSSSRPGATVSRLPAVGIRRTVAPVAHIKSAVRGPMASDGRKPSAPTNPVNSVDRRAVPGSHTRIPSLSRRVAIPTAVPAQKSTGSNLRTTGKSETTSTPHSRITSMSQLQTSRPAPVSKRTQAARLQLSRLPDDLVHSLLADGEEVVGEEFLFKV